MSTVTITLLITNIVLIILCLTLVYPKVIQFISKKKKLRETKAKQRSNIKKAQFVKSVRTEVRKYLEELQEQ